MKTRFPLALLAGITWAACQSEAPRSKALTPEQLEAREDSLDFAASRAQQASITAFVTPDAETKAVVSAYIDDDAADDMAIWVNADNPENSTVIGTNKKGGVAVYNLRGEEIAFYPTGRINNIDVLYGFVLNGEKTDLVGCTNRSDQSVDLFRINPNDGTLADIADHALQVDSNAVKDVYGFCFYPGSKPFLFINGKNGVVQQFELLATPRGKIDLRLVRQLVFDSQTEGMVADEARALLYVGEEDRGIWRVPAEPDADSTRTFVADSGADNPNIAFDVEGLTLYKKNGDGYLLASSQGNFSYAVFERNGENSYLASFKITDGEAVDGVEETDGIDVVSLPLGSLFPQGLFVAQDGFNFDVDGRPQRQNFKLVRWEKIERLLQKK